MDEAQTTRRPGRPRSREADQAILNAARELLIEEGYEGLRVEHVAAKAKVGKATLYRRWSSKTELAEALLENLANPAVAVPDAAETRTELVEVVMNTITALTETPFGAVIRALLSQIASNPDIGDPFRASVVQSRRTQVAEVLERGIDRGDLRPETRSGVATEILVGPVYYRLIFGGELDRQFAEQVVDNFLDGSSATSKQ